VSASFKYIKNGVNQDNDTLVLGLFETLLWHVSIDSDPGWQEKSSQWIHASCTSSWRKGSNIQYATHKPFRDEAFKQIMKAHEEWQARHGYARADNNHEACYVNWLLAGRVSRLCWSLKGRRSCMKSTFKCWRFQYGIKFWITLCLHLERQWKKT
jgi:hypothetical protein